MRSARDTLVMLLAGGVGSRLSILASRRAKPAVPFGGAYRIIDFTLSNVMHAGLERVGLLTQYKPASLMDHVQGGEPWDLVGRERGVKILPPHTGSHDSDWYKGTADAIFQNLWFMEDYKPQRVLILSGDHVYKMDYEGMIARHESTGAHLTIAAMPVPWDEASRFGTMLADGDGWITGFEEKVAKPTSNLASMGVYVFDYPTLVEELQAHVATKRGFDFGKNIIPEMLGRRRLLCYPFTGYWRDVGTFRSFLDANLDCLDPTSGLALQEWDICTGPDEKARGDRPPVRLGATATVTNSLVARGCVIHGTVANSVLFPGVHVGRGAHVHGSVVMHDSRIGSNALVTAAILDKEVVLGPSVTLGEGDTTVRNHTFPTHLSSGLTVVGKQAILPRRLHVGTNCLIYPGVDLSDRDPETVGDGESIEE